MSRKDKSKEYKGNRTSRENGLIVNDMVEAYEKKLSESKK